MTITRQQPNRFVKDSRGYTLVLEIKKMQLVWRVVLLMLRRVVNLGSRTVMSGIVAVWLLTFAAMPNAPLSGT
jgi:hypothetical protein